MNTPKLHRGHSIHLVQYTFSNSLKELLIFAEIPFGDDDEDLDSEFFFKDLTKVTKSNDSIVEYFGFDNEAEQTLLTPALAGYKELLKNLFVVSIECFVAVKEQIVCDLETKDFVENYHKSTTPYCVGRR